MGLSFVQAQNTVEKEALHLTVFDCVERARKQSLNLQQADLNIKSAEWNRRRSQGAYLPNLNGSWNFQRNFGTTFNALTFSRSNEENDFSSPRLSLGYNLFSGFQNYYSLMETEANLDASQFARKRTENQVLLSVLTTFLQIVFDEQNLRQQQIRQDLIERQLVRTRARQEAGAARASERLNLESQLANEQAQRVSLQNQLERDKLTLLQALQLPFDQEFVLIEPDTASMRLGSNWPALNEVRLSALQLMPEISEARMNVDAAEWAVKRARASLYPTLSLSGALSSQYTSQTNPFFFQPDRTGYFPQIQDAFQQTVGLQLQIPILNGMQARTGLELAKVTAEARRLNLQTAQLQLEQEVQRAWLDVRLAQRQIDALAKQLDAQRRTLELSEKQYEAGAMDFYALNEILNNLSRIEMQDLQARYDLFFRRKILDLYLGKPLEPVSTPNR